MRYPEEVKQQARALRERGYSQDVIARELGVNQSTVGYWLNPELRQRRFARDVEYNQRRRLRHPLYNTWDGIKQRCLNSKCPAYPDYGGRGIRVYPAWDRFAVFEEWVLENLGPRPVGYSLDRIDNDGNYEPGNLRWADAKTQVANRRQIADLQAELDAYRAKYGPLEAA